MHSSPVGRTGPMSRGVTSQQAFDRRHVHTRVMDRYRQLTVTTALSTIPTCPERTRGLRILMFSIPKLTSPQNRKNNLISHSNAESK